MNDESFKIDFSEKSIRTTQSRNAKIVRYILCRLEMQAGGVDIGAFAPVDWHTEGGVVEMVLTPPSAAWRTLGAGTFKPALNALSNAALLF